MMSKYGEVLVVVVTLGSVASLKLQSSNGDEKPAFPRLITA